MSNLPPDLQKLSWFKAATAVAAPLAIAAFAAGFDHAANLCLGLLFFAIGEWINHPMKHQVGYGGFFTWHEREFRMHGLVISLIGIALLLIGLCGIFKDEL